MRRRPTKLSLKECYDILRLEKGADIDTLKRAYRRRAFELHPDLNPNNPDASRLFQLLNEAYVALSAILKPAAESGNEQRVKSEPEKEDTSSANEEKQQEDAKTSDANRKTDETKQEKQKAAATDAGGQQDTAGAKHGNAYAEQDVLRDLLNDPFARRVFEDIYSELNRQEVHKQNDIQHNQQETKNAAPQAPHPPSGTQPRSARPHPKQSTRLHQGNLAWGTPKWSQNIKNGVTGAVKGWLRRQIDEEQKLTLPAAKLVPGRRIRLQIRQGLSDDVQTVEITLPQDFAMGKPIRLKGLGKKVGPWQGDLYLTINSE